MVEIKFGYRQPTKSEVTRKIGMIDIEAAKDKHNLRMIFVSRLIHQEHRAVQSFNSELELERAKILTVIKTEIENDRELDRTK